MTAPSASIDVPRASSRRGRRALFSTYIADGIDRSWNVGSDAVIVAEQDGFYTLYAVAVTASDGSWHRHLLVVPTNTGAASFDVGLALLEVDSIEVDAGRFETAERLANALKRDYRRYRAFPPPAALNRFCM